MAELASLAEQSGWDGVFLEDYVFFPGGHETYDPWVTPDHLSGGRLVLGVGSGDSSSDDFGNVGEMADLQARAAALDEGLEVVAALWSGEEVSFGGAYVNVSRIRLRPRPVQRPRIPIWVGGCLTKRGPRERALQWDGACLYRVPPPDWEDLTPDDVRMLGHLARQRRGDDAFVGRLAAVLDVRTPVLKPTT